MPKRHDAKGRTVGKERYVALPFYLLQSPAYRSLSLAARAAFVEACAFYNGSNNGKIILSVRILAERLNASKDTASRALTELDDRGFMVCMKMGSFGRKRAGASEYRLTHLPCDVTGERRTSAFMVPSVSPSNRTEQSEYKDTQSSTSDLAKENYLFQSDHKDHDPPQTEADSPIIGTQVSYQAGGAHAWPELPSILDRRQARANT